MAAAAEAFKNPDAEALAALDAALAAETDAGVRAMMEAARASAVLAGDAGASAKVEAIATVAGRGRDALPLLTPLAASDDVALSTAAARAIAEIERRQAMWDLGQNLWFGLSLGSVLLLAAVGLAITFGVMGVINMAHGELIMLGAYTTFLTQAAIRAWAPGLLDWSLLVAVPAAFLVAGGVGVAIERGIVRHLYGRPLETLLATWGVSLILQQAVRTIFGPTNREVGDAVVDVGVVPARRDAGHLEPLRHHPVRARGLRRALDPLEAHALRAADARGHPEPGDGGGDGHPHRAASTR